MCSSDLVVHDVARAVWREEALFESGDFQQRHGRCYRGRTAGKASVVLRNVGFPCSGAPASGTACFERPVRAVPEAGAPSPKEGRNGPLARCGGRPARRASCARQAPFGSNKLPAEARRQVAAGNGQVGRYAFSQVAQIFNLLYRRFSTCKRSDVRRVATVATVCRLQIGDTADWKICATRPGRDAQQIRWPFHPKPTASFRVSADRSPSGHDCHVGNP